jgi:plastocyanin
VSLTHHQPSGPISASVAHRRRPTVAAAIAMVVLAFAIMAVEAQPAHAVSHSVTIANIAFSPTALTVVLGDTVTWTNHDSVPHTVTVSSGPETFSSPTLNKGDHWSFTFTKAGTYKYYCAIHPNMVAAVTVAAASPGGAPTTATPGTMPGMTTTAAAGGSSSCTNQDVVTAMVRPFIAHLDHAHLEESVGQQVTDLLNLNQYVLTHTVLLETCSTHCSI